MRKEEKLWQQYTLLHQFNPQPDSEAKVDYYSRNSANIKKANSHLSPRHSLLITAFNEQDFLPRTLASVNMALAALKLAIEVIVVDNASTDGTAEIAQEFGAKVVREPVKGIGRARQTALEASSPTSRQVLSTDADTVIPENWAIDHLEGLMAQGYILTYGMTRYFSDTELPLSEKIGLFLYQQAAGINRKIKQSLKNRAYVASCNMAFDRDFALLSGGYDTTLARGEDVDLMQKLSALGEIGKLNEVDVLTSNRRIVGKGILTQVKSTIGHNLHYYLTGEGMMDTVYEDYRTGGEASVAAAVGSSD